MRRWHHLANVLAAGHAAYFTLLAAAAWWPWWVQSNLITFVVAGLAVNRWRCWVTQLEYRWRRRAAGNQFLHGQGLIRRLLNAPRLLLPGRWRYDVGETVASVVLVALLAGVLALRWWVQGAAFLR